jgi:2-phosphoglycolate phosphatase
MKTGIDAIFFDLDGTLADTAPDLGNALNRLRADEGMPPLPMEILRPQASNGTRGLLGVGFGIAPGDPDYARLADGFLGHYAQAVCQDTVLFDGVAELLTTLDTLKMPWGIVTNKPQRFTLPLLDALGLQKRCIAIVSGDSTPHLKPHPASLLLACVNAEVEPQRCMYVGDDERDIVAGAAAGMRTVAAAYGYLGSNVSPECWRADAIVQCPAEILGVLERL